MSDSILKVTQIASGDLWAGAEVQLFTLCKALLNIDKLELNVILLNHGELEKKLIHLGVQVYVYDESKLSSLSIYILLCKHLAKFRPHVIHSHRTKENILSSIASKFMGISCSIRTLHGGAEFLPGWNKPHKKILHWLNNVTGRYLQQKIIAVSPSLAKDIEKIYSKKKIALIENGVDINALKEYIILPEKKQLNSPLRIGIVGRLVQVKRVDIFLEVAQKWKKDYPEKMANFYIYGDGLLENELKIMAKNLGVLDTVHFEGHCDSIHEKIASLDALLITSDHEGLPMTLLEAMTLGTPVIAHAIGGIPHALEEGACGWLTTSQSSSDITNILSKCLSSPSQKIDKLHKSQNRINEFYSASYNAQQYYILYKTFLN